jgi:hypothetical protein
MPKTTTKKESETKTYRFKLLRGRHHDMGITYHRGDVFDSKKDLRKLGANSELKFQPVGQEVPITSAVQRAARAGYQTGEETNPIHDPAAREPLESMTMEELLDYAKAEEVPLQVGAAKSKVIDALLTAGI